MANATFNNSTSHGTDLSFLKRDGEVMRYDCHRKSRKL